MMRFSIRSSTALFSLQVIPKFVGTYNIWATHFLCVILVLHTNLPRPGQMMFFITRIFLCATDYCYYRTITSGWQGAPYFRRYGRELGFKTGDFVKENVRGLHRRTARYAFHNVR